MRVALLLLPLLPLAAGAQKLEATTPPRTYHVGSEQASLYRNAADTLAGKPDANLRPNAESLVVGMFSPNWVVVRHEGFLYLAPVQKLADFNTADALRDRAADAAGLPVDPRTRFITYEGVVQVSGVSKHDLYTRAYAWVAHTYRSAGAAIQLQDQEAGQLVATGSDRVTIRSMGMTNEAGVVRHLLTIYVKDGRYKYILTNLVHEAVGVRNLESGGPLEQEKGTLYLGSSQRVWDEIKQQANRDVRVLVANLQAAMTL